MNDLTVVLSVIGFTLALCAAVWLARTNYRLAADNEQLRHDVALLQIACDEARGVFQRYVQIHQAKDTPEGDKKALTNLGMVEGLSGVLKQTGFVELGPLQRSIRDLSRRVQGIQQSVGNG